MTRLCGPFPAALVAKVAEAVMNEHDWRWALRDGRSQEGVSMACTAPGCEWWAERGDRAVDILWDLHRAHVGQMVAAELAALEEDK